MVERNCALASDAFSATSLAATRSRSAALRAEMFCMNTVMPTTSPDSTMGVKNTFEHRFAALHLFRKLMAQQGFVVQCLPAAGRVGGNQREDVVAGPMSLPNCF
jgi:hypothetical protein